MNMEFFFFFFFQAEDGIRDLYVTGVQTCALPISAMLGAHLLIAGPAEAVVTAIAVRYAQAAGLPLYGADTPLSGGKRRLETFWAVLLALCALSPLGLLARGDAWGEWDTQALAGQIQQVEGRTYV